MINLNSSMNFSASSLVGAGGSIISIFEVCENDFSEKLLRGQGQALTSEKGNLVSEL